MIKLKHEFVETISRLFLEKHCVAAFNEIVASGKKISDTEVSFSKAVLYTSSFFDLISQSNEGFLTL